MRELPGDIGIRSIIERRHDPQQPGCRQLRVGHIEKRRQRGLDQLDRDASVPDTLRQTPADIVENFRPVPIGEVQSDVLPQFPEQCQCPRHRNSRGLGDRLRQPIIHRPVRGRSGLRGLRRPMWRRAKQRGAALQQSQGGLDRELVQTERPAFPAEPQREIAAMQRVCQIEPRPHPRVRPPQLDHQPGDGRRPKDREARIGFVKSPSPPVRGEREGPVGKQREGEVRQVPGQYRRSLSSVSAGATSVCVPFLHSSLRGAVDTDGGPQAWRSR